MIDIGPNLKELLMMLMACGFVFGVAYIYGRYS
jgi:hypothetical protein